MDFFEISNLPTGREKKMPVIKDYSNNRGIGDFFRFIQVFGKLLIGVLHHVHRRKECHNDDTQKGNGDKYF